MIYSFAVFSPEEIADPSTADLTLNETPFNVEGDGYKIGMELYFKRDMILFVGDFMLGNDSPMLKAGEQRV